MDAAGASVVTTIDVAADAVSTVPAPTGTALTACAGDGDDLLLAGDRVLFSSSDGATFEPLVVLAPGERVGAVGAGPAGFAVVTGQAVTGDGFLLAGADVRQLGQRLDVPGLGGPGEQLPTGVIVRRRRRRAGHGRRGAGVVAVGIVTPRPQADAASTLTGVPSRTPWARLGPQLHRSRGRRRARPPAGARRRARSARWRSTSSRQPVEVPASTRPRTVEDARLASVGALGGPGGKPPWSAGRRCSAAE